MQKTIFLGLMFFSLTGCAVFFEEDGFDIQTKDQNRWTESAREFHVTKIPSVVTEGSKIVHLRRHVLNERIVTPLYRPMLHIKAQQEDLFVTRRYVIKSAFDVKTRFDDFTVKPGTYPLFGRIDVNGEERFILEPIHNTYLIFNRDGYFENIIAYTVGDERKVRILPDKLNFTPKNPRIEYEEDKKWVARYPTLEFEVIYDGIRDGQMSFFFKDSVPGTDGERGTYETYFYPRDAMTIELAGMLLRVFYADNDKIEFMVIQNDRKGAPDERRYQRD